MIKVCQKKFPPFKRKKRFLAVFVTFPKSQKRPKINFFFWKVEIFLARLNHLGKQYFFIFYTFFTFFWPKVAPPSTLRAKKSVKYKFSWKVYKIEIVTFDLNKNWYFIKFWPYMSIYGTFWLLKAKKWGKMGQKRCARSGLHHIWLILMKSVQN